MTDDTADDKWSKRYPPGYGPIVVADHVDPVLEQWRQRARISEAAGVEVDFIDQPLSMDRISRPESAMRFDRSILEWACQGTLQRFGGGK